MPRKPTTEPPHTVTRRGFVALVAAALIAPRARAQFATPGWAHAWPEIDLDSLLVPRDEIVEDPSLGSLVISSVMTTDLRLAQAKKPPWWTAG